MPVRAIIAFILSLLTAGSAYAFAPYSVSPYTLSSPPSASLSWQKLFYVYTEALRAGDSKKAEATLNSLLDLAKSLKDDSKLSTVADELADLYISAGRYREAASAYLMSIEALKNSKGANDAAVGAHYCKLSSVYIDENLYARAEGATTTALEIIRKSLGQGSLGAAVCLHNLAWLEARRGAFSDAEKNYLASMEIFQNQDNSFDVLAGLSANNLAEIFVHEHRFLEAERFYERAINILVGKLEDDDMMITIMKNYTHVLRVNHKAQAARTFETKWGLTRR